MAKQMRIADPELIRQANTADQVYIGKNLFVSVSFDDDTTDARLTPDEVSRVNAALADQRPRVRGSEVLEFYDVTDPEELQVLQEALQDKSPLLQGDEARNFLKARLREHGIG